MPPCSSNNGNSKNSKEHFFWQVIAYGLSRSDVKPFSLLNEYGVVGTYNGHLTTKKQGRIVVDSSFHHWVDVNITGNLDSKLKLKAKN